MARGEELAALSVIMPSSNIESENNRQSGKIQFRSPKSTSMELRRAGGRQGSSEETGLDVCLLGAVWRLGAFCCVV